MKTPDLPPDWSMLDLDSPGPAEVTCPDCGPVLVQPDVFDGGKPVSGLCPECNERLHFA